MQILKKVEKFILDHNDEYTEYLESLLNIYNNELSTEELKLNIIKELKFNEESIDDIIQEDEEDSYQPPFIEKIIGRLHYCSSELEVKELLAKIIKELEQ